MRDVETNQTMYFESSFGRIAYEDSGSGRKTLVLTHGLPTSRQLFTPMIQYLSSKYRLIRFDLNDYGESAKVETPITHKDRARVLEEFRLFLKLKKFYLVSHDLGSSVAIDYMGLYSPDKRGPVKKFVIMSPPVYPDFVEPSIVKLVRIPLLGESLVLIMRNLLFGYGIKRGMFHKDYFTPGLKEAMSAPFRGRSGRAALLRVLRWGRPRSMFADYPAIIKSIKIPVLILQGFRDPYIPKSQVYRLKEDLADARLVFIRNGSHFLPMDTPAEVAREINDFIE